MDFQLSLEKKIKYVAILDRFLGSFEITHDLHFFKQFSCILKFIDNDLRGGIIAQNPAEEG